MTAGTIVCIIYGGLLLVVIALCRAGAKDDGEIARTRTVIEPGPKTAARAHKPLGGDGWPLLPTDRQPTHSDFFDLMSRGHSFQ